MSRQSAVNCTLSKLTFRPDGSNALESMIVVTFVDIYATLLVSTLVLEIVNRYFVHYTEDYFSGLIMELRSI